MARILAGTSLGVVSSLWPVSGDADGILALLREWDAAEDPRPLVIATSGSTGEPKRVLLSRDAMRASARGTEERLGGPGRRGVHPPPARGGGGRGGVAPPGAGAGGRPCGRASPAAPPRPPRRAPPSV